MFPFGGPCELMVKIRDAAGSYSYAVTLSLVAEPLVQAPVSGRGRPGTPKAVAEDLPLHPPQVIVHPVTAADAAVSRLAARLTTQHFLRMSRMTRAYSGGDLMTGLVMHAVIAGNIGYVDQDPDTFGRYASIDDVPPDAVRRPVGVPAVAEMLGISQTTVRRHVDKLVKAGLCVRLEGGVVAPSARMHGPWEHSAMLTNMASLRSLYRALKRAGANFQ